MLFVVPIISAIWSLSSLSIVCWLSRFCYRWVIICSDGLTGIKQVIKYGGYMLYAAYFIFQFWRYHYGMPYALSVGGMGQ